MNNVTEALLAVGENIAWNLEQYQANPKQLIERAKEGGDVFLFLEHDVGEFAVDGKSYEIIQREGLTFLVRDEQEALTKDFAPDAFSFFYNKNEDYIDFLADSYIKGEGIQPLLYTYDKPDFHGFAHGVKKHLPIVGYLPFGKGRIFFSTLKQDGRRGYNPVMDQFLLGLLGRL